MRIKHLILGLTASMVLASCAPVAPVEDMTTQRNDTKALPKEFSLLDLGHVISDGTVDIYDPWLDVFLVNDIEPYPPVGADAFPVNPYMLVRDEDVRVYSLDSDMVSDASEFIHDSSDMAPPVPLVDKVVDKEPLTP